MASAGDKRKFLMELLNQQAEVFNFEEDDTGAIHEAKKKGKKPMGDEEMDGEDLEY